MPVILGPAERAFLEGQRRLTLGTIAPDGRPRLVPCCFAIIDGAHGPLVVTPIDDKPKRSSDPMSLARVRDIERDPRVTLLADHWDEDWSRLAWLRIDGLASLLGPAKDPDDHDTAVRALRGRHPQYASHRLEELPVIAITPVGTRSWFASESGSD